MEKGKKIRALVVDDSRLSREIIIRGLSGDPQIEVAASAGDPFEARDKILQVHPDVITCDIEMPRMNGIEFVRRLLPQYFVPVVMVSSVSQAVFQAMEAGAVDFVVKPDARSPDGTRAFIHDLIAKVKAASMARAAPPRREAARIAGNVAGNTDKLIAIGASTGGPEAIYSILRLLPPTMPGIVIVQHIPPVFSKMFAERLNSQTPLRVKEAQTGDYVETGTALVAPGDRQMIVKKTGGRFRVECFRGEKVNGHCPSVDVLFDSVADQVKNSAIAVLLTGMGYDGAKGLLAIRRKGGRTIGQDEASSVVYGMPKVAFNIGAVEQQAALENIPQLLSQLLR